MNQIATAWTNPQSLAWGEGPSARYDALAARFRPIFATIAGGAVTREVNRSLPLPEIALLKEAGFGALRLPEAEGGLGATIPELLALLIELAEADSNIPQALRGHFGFVENLLSQPAGDYRARWAARIAKGETLGNAWSEVGEARQEAFSTTVTAKDGGYVLNGQKYYTTGSLYADWVDVGVTGPDGLGAVVAVRRDAPGVVIADDWDGFGQTLTASGTATFTDAPVDAADLVPDEAKFRYGAAFYQAVHLATLAGLGRALSRETAAAVAQRRRHYTNSTAPRAAQDPQILQVIGRIRSSAYVAGAVVLQVGRAIERAALAHTAGDPDAEERANAVAELETSQTLTVLTDLILDSATIAFDTLGASATQRSLALDRFWRNARTLTSHNPRIYKDRIIGDYAVNGTPPPYQWRIGLPPN